MVYNIRIKSHPLASHQLSFCMGSTWRSPLWGGRWLPALRQFQTQQSMTGLHHPLGNQPPWRTPPPYTLSPFPFLSSNLQFCWRFRSSPLLRQGLVGQLQAQSVNLGIEVLNLLLEFDSLLVSLVFSFSCWSRVIKGFEESKSKGLMQGWSCCCVWGGIWVV